MTELIDITRLHPHTVANAHEHLKRMTRGPARNSRVVTIRVDPRVWATAKELADGDCRRIQVIHISEVIIHNHPR